MRRADRRASRRSEPAEERDDAGLPIRIGSGGGGPDQGRDREYQTFLSRRIQIIIGLTIGVFLMLGVAVGFWIGRTAGVADIKTHQEEQADEIVADDEEFQQCVVAIMFLPI